MIGLWASLVFYNSYLPDVAFPEQQYRASARGFSMGYVGSVLLLLFNLYGDDARGLWNKRNCRRSRHAGHALFFCICGIWWLGFSQVSFYFLPKGNRNNEKVTRDIFWNGFRELRNVYRQMAGNFPLKRYLSAFIFSLAVQTVMLVAAYFGEEEIAWGSDSEKTMGLL